MCLAERKAPSIFHYTTLSLLLKLSLWYNRVVSNTENRAGTSDRLRRIGLNAQLLSLAPNYRSAGINRYIYNILTQLSKHEGEFSFSAFLSDRRFQNSGSVEQRISRLPTARPPVRIFWEQVVQPWLALQLGLDLLHSMAFAVPVWAPCPSVVTIYDLSFLRYPDKFRRTNRLYLSQFVRLAAKRADHFIVISQSTARDTAELLGVDPARISVTYCGVEERFRPLPPEEVEHFRRKKGLPQRMVLYVGTIEPRKNIGTLLKAYHQLLSEMNVADAADGNTPRLVIAGGKGWGWEEIFVLVETLDLERMVVFPGFVPDEELPLWYNAAECFAYPSRYEGFGLPVLEAMACGTPVVASEASSLPEVVGDTGVILPPDDVEGLTGALRRVLTDGGLKEALRRRGLDRASLFTWEETARQTLSVYDRVLTPGGC